MTYRSVLVFAGLLAATLVLAQESNEGSDAPDMLRQAQWQRDGDLIEKFVDGAIRLAEENDPLERARQCNGLAAALARHMQHATANGEAERTSELGAMLQELLVKGIADNLSLARTDLPPEAPRSKDVLQIGATVADFARPLAQALEKLPLAKLPPVDQQTMQATLETVTRAFEQVNQSSQGKGPKGKGKKGKKF